MTDYNKATWGQNFVASVAGASASLIVSAPLDVIKTRMQTQNGSTLDKRALPYLEHHDKPKTSWAIGKEIFHSEGVVGLYRGLGVCSLRAFVVNAVQVGVSFFFNCWG